ncbi:MAG: hypothetical protein JXQ73_10120 [Phycisphaerae bacterium]|nr:hypothetical protein [Phycisphaerae bacterium]
MDEPFTTTGIGSVPLTDPVEATRFVLDAGLDIPFWPQLPKRAFRELMVPQCAEGLPCLEISPSDKRVWLDLSDPDRKANELAAFYERYLGGDLDLGAMSADHAAGWYAFIEAIACEGRSYPALKGHVTGPMTMALGLNDQDGKPVYYDADVFDCVVKLVELKARWQAARLREHCDKVVIFLDEPVLAAFGSSAYLSITDKHVIGAIEQIVEPLHAEGVVVGVHCCGNTDWAMFLRSGIDILSFDAFQYAGSLVLYADAAGEFLARGGRLAWGLVPTVGFMGTATVEQVQQVWSNAVTALSAKGIDPGVLARQAILTPSCGTGTIPQDRARQVFPLLRELRERLRA